MYPLSEFLLITYPCVILVTALIHFELKNKYETIKAFIVFNVVYFGCILLLLLLKCNEIN